MKYKITRLILLNIAIGHPCLAFAEGQLEVKPQATLQMQLVAEAEQLTDQQKTKAAAQFLGLYFNELDCENVGFIQTGEADDHFAPIFLASDTDSSRSLSRQEIVNNPFAKDKALLDITFSEMDANGDGKASPDELRDYLNAGLKRIDSDNNGDVYPNEVAAARTTGKRLSTEAANAKTKAKQSRLPPWERHAKASHAKQNHGDEHQPHEH
ncbi:hypothetical protein [Halioxenophilus aromaticivorans]|uniref:EF-hand domain-containing protein n=1 Tax=Halioxenophilus aromaticivorans TaxID=1306992 RepID=A0AAV3U4W2_9ALTE